MKRRRRKSCLIDVGERSHCAAITDPQQIEVIRMLAIFTQYGDRINAGAVMMELPLYTAIFRRKNEVPIAAGGYRCSPNEESLGRNLKSH